MRRNELLTLLRDIRDACLEHDATAETPVLTDVQYHRIRQILQPEGPEEPAPSSTRWRKKPIVISAFRLGLDPWPDWAWRKVTTNDIVIEGERNYLNCAQIKTLEGWMLACRGDYIIQGIKGEVYPCKPDIFAATYEPAPTGEPQPQEPQS